MSVYPESRTVSETLHVIENKFNEVKARALKIAAMDTVAFVPFGKTEHRVIDVSAKPAKADKPLKVIMPAAAAAQLAKVTSPSKTALPAKIAVPLKVENVRHCGLECMITSTCGVVLCTIIGDKTGQKLKCYFEVDELNLKGGIRLKDIVCILEYPAQSTGIYYQAVKIDGDGPITYMTRNFQLSGTLGRPFLSHVALKSTTAKPHDVERMGRLASALDLYKRQLIFPIGSLREQLKKDIQRLENNLKNHNQLEQMKKTQPQAKLTPVATKPTTTTTATATTTTTTGAAKRPHVAIQAPKGSSTVAASETKYKKSDIVNSVGLVKAVLDDNFALVYGPAFTTPDDKTFCLFDVCDFYLSHDETAADAGKGMKDVVKEGDRVKYNACFVDGTKEISHLATSVWSTQNKKMTTGIPGLPKTAIQPDKMEIYGQVSAQCSPLIQGILKTMAEAAKGAAK